MCLSSELSLFLKVFVHVARWDVCAQFICVCLGGIFGLLCISLCVCVFCHVTDMTGANADSVWRW